jgi:cytoskeleton protein RodZ
MSELGERLRQAREQQGLSLEQVAVETRILKHALIALEDGAYARLPGDVVTRGFIRNYAQYLALSAEELIDIYRRERGSTERIRIVPATNPPRIRGYGLPSMFGVFFVTMIVVGLAYVGLNAIGRIGNQAQVAVGLAPSSTIAPPTALPTLPPAASSVAGGAGVVFPTRTPAPDPQAGAALEPSTPAVALTATANAPIVVEVRIAAQVGSESSWVRVQTDGNTTFEGVMRSGDRQVFQAQRRVLIRAGNPPDVLVTVNGLEQGPLGQVRGQPVNWPWPPN